MCSGYEQTHLQCPVWCSHANMENQTKVRFEERTYIGREGEEGGKGRGGREGKGREGRGGREGSMQLIGRRLVISDTQILCYCCV